MIIPPPVTLSPDLHIGAPHLPRRAVPLWRPSPAAPLSPAPRVRSLIQPVPTPPRLPELFKDVQLFQLRSHKCRHPGLVDYIRKIVDSAVDQLSVVSPLPLPSAPRTTDGLTNWMLAFAQGALEKLIIVIKKDDISEEPLERFVLDFTWLVDHDHLVGSGNWRSASCPPPPTWVQLLISSFASSFFFRLQAEEPPRRGHQAGCCRHVPSHATEAQNRG